MGKLQTLALVYGHQPDAGHVIALYGLAMQVVVPCVQEVFHRSRSVLHVIVQLIIESTNIGTLVFQLVNAENRG